MKRLLSILFCVVYCTAVCYASDNNDYWLKIKELIGKGTPQDHAKTKKYLMSLTKDQTLTALRQYGETVEAEYSADMWPQMVPTAWLIMECYAEPPRLSVEELAKLPAHVRRNYEAGGVPGPLSDKAFNKLVTGIANNKEGIFFRYSFGSVDRRRIPVSLFAANT